LHPFGYVVVDGSMASSTHIDHVSKLGRVFTARALSDMDVALEPTWRYLWRALAVNTRLSFP